MHTGSHQCVRKSTKQQLDRLIATLDSEGEQNPVLCENQVEAGSRADMPVEP